MNPNAQCGIACSRFPGGGKTQGLTLCVRRKEMRAAGERKLSVKGGDDFTVVISNAQCGIARSRFPGGKRQGLTLRVLRVTLRVLRVCTISKVDPPR